jgi:outer membrane protein
LIMKRFALISTLLFAVALTAALEGQEPASAPVSSGVVTVNFNAAVLQTAEARREMKALESKYAPRQAQLKALNDQIADLQKQLQAAGDKLSDAERAAREQSLSVKQKQLQRDSEDYRTDTQADSQQVFQGVAQKLFTFLQSYAQQHGYAMVVERGSDSAPVVWYAAGNLDITEALVKAYDAQAGSGTAGAVGRPGAGSGVSAAPKPQPPAPK